MGVSYYLTITPVLDELFRGVNKRAIIEELKEKGWIALTSRGTIMETKSICGNTKRGLVFIPSAWANDM